MHGRAVLYALCFSWVLGIAGFPVFANPPVAPEPDGTIFQRIALTHAEPLGVLRILTAETDVDRRSGALHGKHSLVPAGIRATIAFPTGGTLMVKGEPPAVCQFALACTLLDVPTERRGDGRIRITLRPTRADLTELTRQIRELPGAGQVQLMAKSLTLEGSAAWLHQALRQAVRQELNGKGAEKSAYVPPYLPTLPYLYPFHQRPSGVIVRFSRPWGSPS